MPESGKLTVFGTFTPKLTAASCDRLGILNITAEVVVPTALDQVETHLNQYLTLHAAPNIGINIPAVGIGTPKFANGQIIFAYMYEGFNGDATTSAVICELEGCDEQEAIETHPNIRDLVKTYGGVLQADGHVIFPLLAPKGVDGIPDADGKTRNPMAGVEDYISVGYTWRRSSIVSQIPNTALSKAGYIDNPMGAPGQTPPSLPSPRNWVKLAPRARWRGNCYELVETWKASGRNGAVKAMYTAPTS